MDYLLTKDYHSIIELAISLKAEEIQHYFFNHYLKLNTTNPDFIDKLNNTINILDERFKLLIERENQSKESNSKTKKNQNLLKINKDWSNHSFFYLEGILNFEFPPRWLHTKYKIFTLNKFNEIQNGFEEFKKKINNENQNNNNPSTTNIKLKWEGQKNQLYQVLRELKEQELISNSYNQLADFIIQNVIPFQNNSKETIEKELKKKKPLPKNKRVTINTLSKTK